MYQSMIVDKCFGGVDEVNVLFLNSRGGVDEDQHLWVPEYKSLNLGHWPTITLPTSYPEALSSVVSFKLISAPSVCIERHGKSSIIFYIFLKDIKLCYCSL